MAASAHALAFEPPDDGVPGGPGGGSGARAPRTLDDALRAALGEAVGRARGPAAEARCLVCRAPVRRERTLAGGFVTACETCGSVLEEDARPQLRLV
jgi:hypothetical protein